MADKWIKSAIKHPGAFSAKAKRAGETTREYASEHAHDSGKLGRQARLAKTLMAMRNKKKHKDSRPDTSGMIKRRYGTTD